MFARLLGWLRATGDPVVEQSAPTEPGIHAAAHLVRDAAREALIGHYDELIAEAAAVGDWRLVDLTLDRRNRIRRPRVRSSVPVIPGRTS